ncbi:hypothetical protein [Sporosarcina obsidiansis]|uniref:hypothetical protein n=1 Tax=Sporosarcina obsidiansis TaxID=2660748 RepID=UPI00129BB78A|nr:hypothetical protein [Sporosarcina obsidiansis]
MKIDHLVVNVDQKYQKDSVEIESIRDAGLPYEPKWGKGTRGFKASNIWIGNEYFEMIRLLKEDGGGWKLEWVEKYNRGHRGLICLMLDVDDLDTIYNELTNTNSINITEPTYLQFKWGFGLFTRTMPWRNSYFPFFEGIPLQIGLQQMKDEKSVEFMRQYMVPNARDKGINGIKEICITGPFTASDFELIHTIFKTKKSVDNGVIIYLENDQKLIFESADEYNVHVISSSNNNNNSEVQIENILVSI